MKTNNKRIEYIDGHRGIAILLVILFHAYSRWPELLPYGNAFGEFPLFKQGWIGVELFFLVSGFVILMTLEKCSTPKQFLYRRWIRLFPAMLICTIIIFATSGFFFERPAGSPTWSSILPGLTFVEPSWWRLLTGQKVNGIEGAFWSLYVEFKFYVFAAVIYYWKGRDAFFRSLIFVFAVAAAVRLAEKFFGGANLKILDSVLSTLSFRYFGWFASGAAFYLFTKNGLMKWFYFALAIAFASAVNEGGVDWQKIVAGLIVAVFFASSVISETIQKILSFRLFLFVGAISYPLYLIHENMMVSIIIKLGKNFESIPLILLPFPAVFFLGLAAYAIYRYAEPFTKSILAMRTGKNPMLPRIEGK